MEQAQVPSWGEQLGNQAVGDVLCVPKNNNTIRIHFQNINGMSLGKGGTWESICESYKHMEVDIGMICEHKLDTTCPGVLKGIREGATHHFGMRAFQTVTGSSPIRHEKYYKPGGTLGIAIGQVKGRVMATSKDKFGRWVSMTFRRQNDAPMTIICTYQVVDVDPTTKSAN